MREADETTRRRILEAIREEPATPVELADRFDLTPAAVMRHVEHVSRSVDSSSEAFLVAPPTCQECGFDRFDDLLNRPSRCPECKSESVTEPRYAIE
ncbi:transcriptional regulator [Natrialbaceae archaeon A-gly3]